LISTLLFAELETPVMEYLGFEEGEILDHKETKITYYIVLRYILIDLDYTGLQLH
jgi:hypothetical protein